MCAAKSDVRFAPNSDRESRHPQTVMSALPPKADMCSAPAHVCFGPIADIAFLFDYLVGLREERRWHRYAQCFSCLKIDHQLVLGRRSKWRFMGFLALGDATDIASRPPKHLNVIGPVRNQPTIHCVKAKRVDSGQFVARRKPEDQIAAKCNSTRRYDQATVAR